MKSSVAQSVNAQSVAESTQSHLSIKLKANQAKAQLRTLLKNCD